MGSGLSAAVVAERAGTDEPFVDRLVELGIVAHPADHGFAESDVRRVRIVQALERGGIALTAIGQAMSSGALTLDFVDQPDYSRFASFGDVTFREMADRMGVPLDVLLVIREAMGGAQAESDDLIRDDELLVVPLVDVQLRQGVRPATVERGLRVMGESLRRIADTEADWWRTEIQDPLFAAGHTPKEVAELTRAFTPELGRVGDQAVLALLHGQQSNAWMRNIFEGFEIALSGAGLHTRPDSIPAICFLDLTGYTRLTDERGDQAAADLAARLARLVQRTAASHGGKPVKWLGDGVMFHFSDPGPGVLAALEMVEGARTDELPPAHVGLHAGPVVFQGGDYFGRTVNIASRIADYARPGEVVVSQDVVDAAAVHGVSFAEIGPVELKGLTGALRLHTARRTSG